MPRVLLFEFEGVLVDTAAARRAALARSLGDDGLLLPEPPGDDPYAGLGVRAAAAAALAVAGAVRDETAADLIAFRAERYFAERAGRGLSLAPGVPELLEALAGRATLALVTRAGRREVEFVLGLGGLTHAFACVVTADDPVDPKPSPAPYALALERLRRRGVPVAPTALALEDARPGVRAARAAGLRVAAVGPLPADVAMEADAYLPTLAGLTPASLDALVGAGEGGR